jgi:hypothetical protein
LASIAAGVAAASRRFAAIMPNLINISAGLASPILDSKLTDDLLLTVSDIANPQPNGVVIP